MLLHFHYNSRHHYHYHHFYYHRNIHFYRLRILLTSPFVCNMIPCLFQLSFIFFLPAYIFPSFSFFTPSNRTQNSFTTTRQILDVLLIFIFIVFYSSLFTFTCLYLFTHTYLYLCFLYTVI